MTSISNSSQNSSRNRLYKRPTFSKTNMCICFICHQICLLWRNRIAWVAKTPPRPKNRLSSYCTYISKSAGHLLTLIKLQQKDKGSGRGEWSVSILFVQVQLPWRSIIYETFIAWQRKHLTLLLPAKTPASLIGCCWDCSPLKLSMTLSWSED